MDRLITGLVGHKKIIIAIFVILTAVGAVLQLFVSVNYNLADYLPPDAQSTVALELSLIHI